MPTGPILSPKEQGQASPPRETYPTIEDYRRRALRRSYEAGVAARSAGDPLRIEYDDSGQQFAFEDGWGAIDQ